MEHVSQLEIREKYMQLSRKLLLATEEGKPESELQQLHEEIKKLEPILVDIECSNPPDCP
jgi:uncharacterized membrane-anchored protein